MEKCDIGLVGLAVMGENLVLNMVNHGFRVAIYNRTVSKVDEFVGRLTEVKPIVGTHSISEFCQSLTQPRKIMLMVKAGQAVDDFIDLLIPHLSSGDVIIDGGNSFFMDTIRRNQYLEAKNFLFIGTGVSGGEEGALKGPSIMPGGSEKGWHLVRPIFQKIAAKVKDGTPCCDYVGRDGAGHYVKMIHNGIEYGDMQLICEAYHLMASALKMSPLQMHKVFSDWNKGALNSYLIEITADILKKKDPETGKWMVDVILDRAGQKGTGIWTSQNALQLGVPAATIVAAVFARSLSALKQDRVQASSILKAKVGSFSGDKKSFLKAIHDALYVSKICSYAQGFALIKAAAKEFKWNLNFGQIALMWRGGCIIRAQFLERIKEAFDRNPNLNNLLLDPFFNDIVNQSQANWRKVIGMAVKVGIPTPAFSTALAYFDSYRCERLPANLLQAQRDYFGAHTYERIDKPAGQFFHTEWLKI